MDKLKKVQKKAKQLGIPGEITISKRKNKKYKLSFSKLEENYPELGKSKSVHFGDDNYLDYLDMLELLDKEKYALFHDKDDIFITKSEALKHRDAYRKRASKITNKNGELTYNKKYTPNYLSYHLLW